MSEEVDVDMANLGEAEQARDAASEQLRQLGAHAVSVEPDAGAAGSGTTGTPDAASSYSVVAYFDHEPPASVPEHVEVQSGGETLRVPVRINRSARFQLE